MADGVEGTPGFFSRIRHHPMLKSFLFYSLFRAIYGPFILLATWLLATESEAPIWVSVLFLVCSMVFSRMLFRVIKKRKGQPDVDD